MSDISFSSTVENFQEKEIPCTLFVIFLLIGGGFSFAIPYFAVTTAITAADPPFAQWDAQVIPGYEATWFRDIEFANDTHGWLAGHGVLLHTEDSGKTWEPQDDIDRIYWSISIVNESELWVVSDSGLHHSVNFGRSWNITNSASMRHICFYNSTFGFVGGHYEFAITANGGVTWTTITNPLEDRNRTSP
ncbi:MAG: YCF48-related protein, partial [Candidatus Thorarchaeota archaeon]|nr:YCF48-related protein [Candidatus Thorarchaeota archaeon]